MIPITSKCSTPHCSHEGVRKDRRCKPRCKRCRWLIDTNIVSNPSRDPHRLLINPSPADLRKCYASVDKMALKLGIKLEESQRHQLAYSNFEVDHIDGNNKNGHPSNLQTLSRFEHRVKTILNGDMNPYKNKKAFALSFLKEDANRS